MTLKGCFGWEFDPYWSNLNPLVILLQTDSDNVSESRSTWKGEEPAHEPIDLGEITSWVGHFP